MHQDPLFPEWQPQAAIDEEKLAELRAFDELGSLARRYRESRSFGKLLDFVISMGELSPYNAALLHLQKPEARMVRTAAGWLLLGRQPLPQARPALLLYPGGPLQFVFDVSETSGEPVAPAASPRPDPAELLKNTAERALREGVAVVGPLFGQEPRGRLRLGHAGEPPFTISLDPELEPAAQYANLVYELARLFLGHLGECPGCGWEARPPADDISGRFEAGTVAAIVCGRAGVPTEAGAFVRGYLQNFAEVPEISLDGVLRVAGRIERLAR
ncbi:hypothetical protein [Oceanithermus sp.]